MDNRPALELILGGARSGKSRYAEDCARNSGMAVTFIATATAADSEMAQRIKRHQNARPTHWQLVEEPLALAGALKRHARPDRCLVVDCMTLWLSNWLSPAAGEPGSGYRDRVGDGGFESERARLLEGLPALPGRIILVGNEVGMGIVPLGALTRRFCDESGRLHQELAGICDRVTLMVAGLPHSLKGKNS